MSGKLNLPDLVSRTPRFENAQIHFFWKLRDLKNTLRKEVKNGSRIFGCKGGTLWSQFFRPPDFDHLPYKSAQKGVLQNRGVDIETFQPSNEQKIELFLRFLIKFFSFFKKWLFSWKSPVDAIKTFQKKGFFLWKHTCRFQTTKSARIFPGVRNLRKFRTPEKISQI